MSDQFSPPEEPQLVGKKWDDKLARNLQDFLRKMRQFGNGVARHASSHVTGGGDAIPVKQFLGLTGVPDGDIPYADSSAPRGIRWDVPSGGGGGSSDDAILFAFFTGD